MSLVSKDPLIGRTLEGRYLIERRIARGGMAVVYEGTDSRLQRKVAIKVMHAHMAEDETFRERFEQEARSAAVLAHPNLVGVLDQGEDSGTVFLVMENVSGMTLRHLLKQEQRLEPAEATKIAEAMLQGLAAAHQAGIIHRDLKPENVLLADDGRIKIGDFGLARAAGANTSTGQALLGTIAYLPPELLTEGIANKQSDIYSFGIMLYEMLTGEQPFKGEQPMHVAYKHANEAIPKPSAINPDVTVFLDSVVAWSCAKDPADRPEDAQELLLAFQTRSVPNGKDDTRILKTSVILDAATETKQLQDSPKFTVNETSAPAINPLRQTHPGVNKAITKQKQRKVFRTLVVLLLLATVAGAFSASWWRFLGPGSDVLVPNVVGKSVADAKKELTASSLIPVVEECHHVSVPPGEIVESSPKQGERIKRESKVTICESIGPKNLEVPDAIGVLIDEAKELITEAGFRFAGIIDTIFSSAEEDSVLAIIDENGTEIPATYPEMSEIWVHVSAGPIPEVNGLDHKEAVEVLQKNKLNINSEAFVYTHSDDVEINSVLRLITETEILKQGDTVSLEISLGPELFEIPDVTDLTIREAMFVIEENGFTAKAPWYLNDAALDAFTARATTPGARELLPLGAEVEVHPKIF